MLPGGWQVCPSEDDSTDVRIIGCHCEWTLILKLTVHAILYFFKIIISSYLRLVPQIIYDYKSRARIWFSCLIPNFIGFLIYASFSISWYRLETWFTDVERGFFIFEDSCRLIISFASTRNDFVLHCEWLRFSTLRNVWGNVLFEA